MPPNAASLDYRGMFTSICCLAWGTGRENKCASTWLPIIHQTEKYPRKGRLSGIVWKWVKNETSLPNLLKCKLRGNWVPEMMPSGLPWKSARSTCQTFRDSVLAHARVHSNNSAEWVACGSASICPFHCGHAPQVWLWQVLGAASAWCSLLAQSSEPEVCGSGSEEWAPLSPVLRSSLASCSHRWWKMGYTVPGRCMSAWIRAVQCRPGRVRCVQVQGSSRLWAGCQGEKNKSYLFRDLNKIRRSYILMNLRWG